MSETERNWDNFTPAAVRVKYSAPFNGRLALHAETFGWIQRHFVPLAGRQLDELELYELVMVSEPELLKRIGLPSLSELLRQISG